LLTDRIKLKGPLQPLTVMKLQLRTEAPGQKSTASGFSCNARQFQDNRCNDLAREMLNRKLQTNTQKSFLLFREKMTTLFCSFTASANMFREPQETKKISLNMLFVQTPISLLPKL
jgi:hypothetical protein